jgi:hypothetical protein
MSITDHYGPEKTKRPPCERRPWECSADYSLRIFRGTGLEMVFGLTDRSQVLVYEAPRAVLVDDALALPFFAAVLGVVHDYQAGVAFDRVTPAGEGGVVNRFRSPERDDVSALVHKGRVNQSRKT